MNETTKSILNRRSTRGFLPEQIKEEELEAIIEAGIYAPSAHNNQPWHFSVIQNKELIESLNASAKETGKNSPDEITRRMMSNEKLHVFYNAPTVIIVSGEDKALLPTVDCAAATQNMLIAAESVGVGSCWVGLVRHAFASEKGEEYIKTLGIPEGYTTYYAVALGYKKANSSNPPERRKNTVNFIK